WLRPCRCWSPSACRSRSAPALRNQGPRPRAPGQERLQAGGARVGLCFFLWARGTRGCCRAPPWSLRADCRPWGGGTPRLGGGLVCPAWLGRDSVSERLPSGPVVIPDGRLLAVGMGNSLMAWVVGLIAPILLVLSVNQRLPSGPVAI